MVEAMPVNYIMYRVELVNHGPSAIEGEDHLWAKGRVLQFAPKIFTALTDVTEWIIKDAGVSFVVYYFDNFSVTQAHQNVPPLSGQL